MRVTQPTWITAFATGAALVVFALPQPEPLVTEAAEAAEAETEAEECAKRAEQLKDRAAQLAAEAKSRRAKRPKISPDGAMSTKSIKNIQKHTKPN